MERSQLRVTFLCHTQSSGLKSVRIRTNQVCNALVLTGAASRRSALRNWLVKLGDLVLLGTILVLMIPGRLNEPDE